MCKSRKLPVTGNKTTLKTRLEDQAKGVYTPKKRRPKKAARTALQKSCRQSTLKMCLKSHLVDAARILPIVNILVDYVSKISRQGGLAVNAVILHHLDRANGQLPDWIVFDEAFFRCCFTGGKLFTGMSCDLDARLAEVPSMVDINRARPAYLPRTHNATTTAVKSYCTAFQNHHFVNFRQRVNVFCARMMRLPTAHNGTRAWTKKQTYLLRCAAARFVFGEPLASDARLMAMIPPPITDEFTALRVKVATCGLRAQSEPTNLRATVETLFYLLQRSHAYEFKGWSIAPIPGFGCRHVRIDKGVFKKFFVPRLVDAGFYTSETAALALAEDNFKALFKNASTGDVNLPQRGKGWEMNPSILTDGYSLCVTYLCVDQARPPQTKAEKREAAKMEKRDASDANHHGVPEQFIGCDPGNVNAATLAGYNGHGKQWFMTLKTSAYKNASGERSNVEQSKRRNRRVQADLDALCMEGVRAKTPIVAEFTRYIQASADHNAALWRSLGHKHTARARMAAFIGSHRVLDAFWNSVPLQKGKRLVMAYGAAQWTPGAIHARIAAPCTLIHRRCAAWVKRKGGRLVMADERFTSQKSPISHNRLADYYINDENQRGLKWDRSSHCLRLMNAGQLSTSLARLHPSGTSVLLSRDRLAADNIRETVARGVKARPRYLCRR